MRVRRFYWLLTWCCLSAAAPGLQAEQSELEYLREIRQQADVFLQRVLSEQSPGDELEISVSRPDPRIALSRCANPLTYSLHGNAVNASNVTVKVTCQATTDWSFYLSANVDRWREVAIAERAISRGSVITGADIRGDRRRLSGVGLGAYSGPEAAMGMVARRPIRAGDVIRTTQLTAPLAVHKGETVRVRAANSAIAIVTSGEALANGRVGEQIRIRNGSSDRIIRARVTGTGQAEVML